MYSKHDEFTRYHPAVNFAYFCVVIIFSVIIFHPAALIISLICAFCYACLIRGIKGSIFFLKMPFAIMILTVILNPLFVHKGITPLFYMGESPVTKEAAIYGCCTALMIGSVMMWFYCYSIVMTSDRFMSIAGRVAPKLSLVFSMALRFIPRLHKRAADIRRARQSISRNEGGPSKLEEGAAQFSMLTTWALENSIDTADSMRAKGYGLPGRTHYSKYTFYTRDMAMLFLIVALTMVVVAGKIGGALYFAAYPQVMVGLPGTNAAVPIAAYFMLCLMPVAVEVVEEIRWRRSRSGI